MFICIPIIAENTEEAIERISEAQAQADMLELRLDLMSSFDMKDIIGAAEKSVIVTYRSEKEGGKGTDDYAAVVGYLKRAVNDGAQYIDVELAMPLEYRDRILKNRGSSKAIVSTHFTKNTPGQDTLERIFRESRDTGADIVKIVTMAQKWEDNLRVLDIVRMAGEEDVKIIAFCMGSLGRMSRIFSLLMGGFLTFASFKSGQESAPGQITVDEMRKMLKYFSG